MIIFICAIAFFLCLIFSVFWVKRRENSTGVPFDAFAVQSKISESNSLEANNNSQEITSSYIDADQKRRNWLFVEAEKAYLEHRKVLVRKYNQLVRDDGYGNKINDAWFREIEYFIDNVLVRNNPDFLDLINRELLTHHMHLFVNSLAENYSLDPVANIDNLSPIEFEHYCANLLKANGWEASLTLATGDQGIDIVAKIFGKTAVFQCKKYSSPVGNSAVQEIYAGMQFANADIAAVISNQPYTPQAIQLAKNCNVALLHYSDLIDFHLTATTND